MAGQPEEKVLFCFSYFSIGQNTKIRLPQLSVTLSYPMELHATRKRQDAFIQTAAVTDQENKFAKENQMATEM